MEFIMCSIHLMKKTGITKSDVRKKPTPLIITKKISSCFMGGQHVYHCFDWHLHKMTSLKYFRLTESGIF